MDGISGKLCKVARHLLTMHWAHLERLSMCCLKVVSQCVVDSVAINAAKIHWMLLQFEFNQVSGEGVLFTQGLVFLLSLLYVIVVLMW